MRDRAFDPRALDVAAFCRAGAALSGAWPLAAMARLAEGLAAVPDTAAAWSVQGSVATVGVGGLQTWIDVTVNAEVPLLCQRCLQPLVEPLAVERRFGFARTEAEATALDEDCEEDILVLQQRLDLHELIEDELILALPLVPRHAECAPLVALSTEEEPVAGAGVPHPFAALAALRRNQVAADTDRDDDATEAGTPGKPSSSAH